MVVMEKICTALIICTRAWALLLDTAVQSSSVEHAVLPWNTQQYA